MGERWGGVGGVDVEWFLDDEVTSVELRGDEHEADARGGVSFEDGKSDGVGAAPLW